MPELFECLARNEAPLRYRQSNPRSADIPKGLLTEHKGRSLDVATACFTVGRFGLIQDALRPLEIFVLGSAPSRRTEKPTKDVPERAQRLTRGDLQLICFVLLTAG